MTNAHHIVGSACAALFMIEILRIPQYVKAYLFKWYNRPMHRRIKPFDCHPCLSFWITIVTGTFLGKNPEALLFNSVTASVLAVLILKNLNK